jgi:hypothetical protein
MGLFIWYSFLELFQSKAALGYYSQTLPTWICNNHYGYFSQKYSRHNLRRIWIVVKKIEMYMIFKGPIHWFIEVCWYLSQLDWSEGFCTCCILVWSISAENIIEKGYIRDYSTMQIPKHWSDSLLSKTIGSKPYVRATFFPTSIHNSTQSVKKLC